MTDAVVLEPKTLVEAMLRTATTQVLVRTILSVSAGNYSHFSADFFMAEGTAEGKVDRLLKIQAHHGTSQIPTRLCGLDFVSGERAPELLAEWVTAMSLRNQEKNTPWFTTWLTKEPFEGILLLSSDYKSGPIASRRLPADHPALMVFFGSISAALSLLAEERKHQGLSQEERARATMLNRLAERFGRFMWAQQQKVLENAVGMGID